jgi:hypothetical protein
MSDARPTTITWGHDLDGALERADGKEILLDFSAAPM